MASDSKHPPKSYPAPSPPGEDPAPVLPDQALYGLAGEIVRRTSPYTEASPAALLADLLVSFGSACGPRPHVFADGARHRLNLFMVVVGATARARKGTSRANIRRLFDLAAPEWSSSVTSGMGSGEGLLQALADDEQRHLMLVESEFGRVLTIADRKGSTVSDYFRQLWDDDRLNILNRQRLSVEGAYLSVIGHITASEVQAKLKHVDMVNGFANRILWVFAARSKLIPEGGSVPLRQLTRMAKKLERAIGSARGIDEMHRSGEASEYWDTAYRAMADDALPHRLDAITSRAEAQTLRLSMVYAALDGSAVIELEHVRAAEAFWHYCRDSAAHVFEQSTGNPVADRILDALKVAEERRLTRAHISGEVLQNNVRKADIDNAVSLLAMRGAVEVTKSTGGRGRPAEVIILT